MFFFFSLPRYLSPETILGGGGPSADVWTFGIILLELCVGKLWQNLKPGPILRRILTLVHAGNPAERIAREHDYHETYKVSKLIITSFPPANLSVCMTHFYTEIKMSINVENMCTWL